MTISTASMEVLHATSAVIGESPLFHDGELVWVDAEGKRVYLAKIRESANPDIVEFALPVPVSAIASSGVNGWILVCKNGLYHCDKRFGALLSLGNPVSNPSDLRLNDCTVSPAGDLWFGSMNGADLEAPDGEIFILHRNTLKIEKLDVGFSVSNGISFDKDRRRVYITNMFKRQVFVYQLEADFRTVRSKEVFLELPEQEGYPDGLKTDSEGNLYVCHWDAGLISIWNPQGDNVQKLKLPVKHATRCTFGGSELRDLYVTSGNYEMSDEEKHAQPLSGQTLRIDSSISGVADNVFGMDQ
ncbi:SMP-30/gluconolactonase/LRE family protein [Parasalinivibrio latis]|uniref:SMP-30/gluconolactonase/LRE family protein n=1 Tax=Parasalinivibrio latis TaxID=2952610 RepID=UPI0030E23CCE